MVPHLDGAEDFSEGLTMVAVGEKRGYMDRAAPIVIQPVSTKDVHEASPHTMGVEEYLKARIPRTQRIQYPAEESNLRCSMSAESHSAITMDTPKR